MIDIKGVVFGAAMFGLGATGLQAEDKRAHVKIQGYDCEVSMSGNTTQESVLSILATLDLQDGPMQIGMGGLPGGDRYISDVSNIGGFAATCKKNQD